MKHSCSVQTFSFTTTCRIDVPMQLGTGGCCADGVHIISWDVSALQGAALCCAYLAVVWCWGILQALSAVRLFS